MMDIASMLEVQVNEVKEVDSKENVTPSDLIPNALSFPPTISAEESLCYRLMFGNDVTVVRFRRLHCTACDAHIGSAPAQIRNMCEHPVLRTLLCAKCREFYGDGTFEQGDDATDMFCRWCANGGNLYCCSHCSNTFCSKCIRRNFDPLVRKKIEADEEWKCFVCDPSDLYSLRAICWALHEHVERVTRVLQNTRYISQEQIDIKMNLDETQCCPRRRKRKRRRESNSDEDYCVPKSNTNSPGGPPKRKIPRKSPTHTQAGLTNGNVERITTAFLIKSEASLSHQNVSSQPEAPTSVHLNEQSVTTSESTPVINMDDIPPLIPTAPDHFLSTLVHQPLYNTSAMNVAATNYLQPTATVAPVRQVVIPPKPVKPYTAAHCSKKPMVKIPNQNPNLRNGTRVLLLKPTQTLTAPVSGNVIQLDNGTESHAMAATTGSSIIVDTSSRTNAMRGQAVPVALVSSECTSEVEKRRERTQRNKRSTTSKEPETFHQRVMPHSYAADFIVSNLKTKLASFFDTAKREEFKKTDANEARQAIIRFHRDIRSAVTQLGLINDRLVREYNRWKRMQTGSTNHPSGGSIETETENAPELRTDVDIPLDMTCVNESDSESDCEPPVDILRPSDLVGATNAVEGIRFFKRRKTVDRGTGENRVSFKDECIQVCETIVPVDYEKCVGHSVLVRSDDEPTTQSDAANTNEVSDENFGKYQEQFIFYLQHIEDHGISAEKWKSANSKETTLKDMINAEPSFISEMLGNIDSSNSTEDDTSKAVEREKNKNEDISNANEASLSVSNATAPSTSHSIEELAKMIKNVTHDMGGSETGHEKPRIRVRSESLKESDLDQVEFCIKKESIELNELANHAASVTKFCESIDTGACAVSALDQDCMVIDD